MPLVNREARLAKQDPRRRFLKYFVDWAVETGAITVSVDIDDLLQAYLDHEKHQTAAVVDQVTQKAKEPLS